MNIKELTGRDLAVLQEAGTIQRFEARRLIDLPPFEDGYRCPHCNGVIVKASPEEQLTLLTAPPEFKERQDRILKAGADGVVQTPSDSVERPGDLPWEKTPEEEAAFAAAGDAPVGPEEITLYARPLPAADPRLRPAGLECHAVSVADATLMQTIRGLTCGSCGVAFGLEQSYYGRMRQDGGLFYCPNGHRIGWTNTGYQRVTQELEYANRRIANLRDDLAVERLSLRATRGHLTRVKKRIHNGVCPYCQRSFSALRKHIHTKHPDQLRPEEVEESPTKP